MEAMERTLQALDDHMASAPFPGDGPQHAAVESLREEEGDHWESLGELLVEERAARLALREGSTPSASRKLRVVPGDRKETGPGKDSVGLYLTEIRRFRLLTREQEYACTRAAQAGDISARDVLITRNLRLVVSIAKRYQGLGLSFSDLIAEGNLGLIRSIDRFDCARGLRFSTYASKWIRQSITRSLVNKSRTVRIPSNVLALLKKISVIQKSFVQEHGRRASQEEICRKLRISLQRLADIYGLTQNTLSLDHPVDQGLGRHKLHDILPASETPDPAEGALRTLERKHVRGLLKELSPREQTILRLRFGFDGQEPRSLEETGNVLGITRERVRQIESRALNKLRRAVSVCEEIAGAAAAALSLRTSGAGA